MRRATIGLLAIPLFAMCLSSACSTPQRRARATTAKAPPLAGRWHRVQAGENLPQLARALAVPVEDLEEINGIDRRRALTAGQQIFVPRVAKKASAPARAKVAAAPSVRAAPASPPAPDRAPGRLQWPVRSGKLTSRFGRRGGRPHEGIDIAAPAGTAILAAADGAVVYAGAGIQGYGNMVIIRHAGAVVTVYAHNRRNLVQRGTTVRRGQVIAEVGNTGRTTGYHLHFEVRQGESPVDPLKYVQPPVARVASDAP